MKGLITFLFAAALSAQVSTYPGGGGNQVTQPYTQSFTSVNSVVLNPNFNTAGSITSCYDSGGNQLTYNANPGYTLVLTNASQITVTFSGGPFTGKCNVLAGIGPAGANGANGTNGTNGSPGLVWQGAYSAGTTYNQNDAVSYSGSSYISLVGSNTGNTPASSPASWSLIAQSGVGGTPASPTNSVQINSSGTFGAVAIGTANQVFGVNNGASGYEFKKFTVDSSGNGILQGGLTTSNATLVNCPLSSGCIAGFAGNNAWGWALPAALTSPLWHVPPNALPAANSFMVFGAPTGSGNTTQSAFQYATFGSTMSVSGATPPVVDVANTAVTPGTYGSSSQIPVITVNQQGQITALSTSAGGGGGVGNPYSTSFTCNSSGSTFLASTHSQGVNPAVNFYDSAGNPTYPDATLAANGDVNAKCPLGTLTGVTVYISGANGPDANYGASFSAATSDSITEDLHGILSTTIRTQVWDTQTPKNLMPFADLPIVSSQFKVTQALTASIAAYLVLYR